MSDYIEREAAINAVFEAMADGRAVFPALNNLPAADVVHVVRCEECKHNTSSPHNPICEYGNRCYCGFFCADGARMDGEQDV